MSKFNFITVLLINASVFAAAPIPPEVNKSIFYELNIKNEKYYLIPAKEGEALFNYQPGPNAPNPCIGSLICYKCCNGDNDIPKETCDKTFKNWNLGKNCNCTK